MLFNRMIHTIKERILFVQDVYEILQNFVILYIFFFFNQFSRILQD